MNQQAAPEGMFPCWYITEEEIERAKKSGKSFAEYTNTEDFFKLTNRIDSTFIQGQYLLKGQTIRLVGRY